MYKYFKFPLTALFFTTLSLLYPLKAKATGVCTPVEVSCDANTGDVYLGDSPDPLGMNSVRWDNGNEKFRAPAFMSTGNNNPGQYFVRRINPTGPFQYENIGHIRWEVAVYVGPYQDFATGANLYARSLTIAVPYKHPTSINFQTSDENGLPEDKIVIGPKGGIGFAPVSDCSKVGTYYPDLSFLCVEGTTLYFVAKGREKRIVRIQ